MGCVEVLFNNVVRGFVGTDKILSLKEESLILNL